MAKEMERYYQERVAAMQARATEQPKELADLTSRIARLRDRLRSGDPDMTADELQAAIDRAEGKRKELEAQQPEAKASAKIFAAIPKAAALYREMVTKGLDGNPREALKAKVFLRGLLGKIVLSPRPDGSLWAVYSITPDVLLNAAAGGGVTSGRGRGI